MRITGWNVPLGSEYCVYINHLSACRMVRNRGLLIIVRYKIFAVPKDLL